MPRRRSQSQKRGLILGALGVLAGFALLAGLSYLSGQGDVDLSNLADRNYQVGSAENYAERIATDEGPILVPDPSPNQNRPIYIDHAGGPVDKGWIAVLAYEDGCALEYVGGGYVDCNGTEHPRDGTGLTRYRTYVEEGAVYVDLRTVEE